MEEEKKHYPPIVDQIREYAETRIKLSKYKIIEKSTSVMAGLITNIVIAVCLTLTFLFASFTLALFLGSVLGSNAAGFGIVTLIYLFIAIVIILMKNSINKPLVNLFVKVILSDKD